MATFTTAQFNAVMDNLGQFIIDSNAGLPSSAQITTASGDLTTEITRVQALTDNLVQPALLEAYTNEQRTTAASTAGPNTLVGRTLTWLNGILYSTLLSNGPFGICDALEMICNNVGANTGVQAFMVANSLVCDVYSADVFNTFQSQVAGGGYARKFGNGNPVVIPSTLVFPHANVDSLNIFTTTSTTAGTLAAGTQSLAKLAGGITLPGGGTLEAYAGNTIQAASYTITVTYTSMAGATGQTVTFAVVGLATANTVFTPGSTIQALSIQSVAITTGTATGAGDIVKFRLKPVRVIAA